MTGGAVVRLGPIGPEHVGDGWSLEGDDCDGWFLSKRVGDVSARIFATTATRCAWGVCQADGRMVRGASALDVPHAKAQAARWLGYHR
ncbi:hypothetical protein [Nocardia terpenica]|uniref:Uncharacterized protein n=1 Tax=Nocardia terpenica TaxID=455432 RepID=A0A6G9Z3I5_9NOCA|nr:hypothetical protein [Nocardia terpenica]QIS20088.1 hypothetical protein F6W96_19110 [Nocardia terpenica]